MAATRDEANAAKKTLLRKLRDAGVEASVGLVKEGAAYKLKVNLTAPPAPGTELPQDIDGVPLQVETTGPVRRR